MQITNLYGLNSYTKLEQSEKNNQARLERERKSADTGTSRSSGDHSTLSDEAKLRAEAFSSAMAAPETRTEKVAAIKARLDSGEYTIDTKQIALKLLSEDAELLGL